jgi:hypothetical protein
MIGIIREQNTWTRELFATGRRGHGRISAKAQGDWGGLLLNGSGWSKFPIQCSQGQNILPPLPSPPLPPWLFSTAVALEGDSAPRGTNCSFQEAHQVLCIHEQLAELLHNAKVQWQTSFLIPQQHCARPLLAMEGNT